MSRRHKESERENTKPQQAEPHADGRLRDKSGMESTSDKIYSVFDGLLKATFVGSAVRYLAGKITQVLGSPSGKIVVDDKWVKIPRSAFNERDIDLLRQYNAHASPQQEERTERSKGGRNPIKQLFSKIADSAAVQFFRKTWDAAKKCKAFYRGTDQFCTSFFIAANKVFSPDDDPYGYGRVSHYHRVIKEEVEKEMPEPFGRKTLNNWIMWFRDWKPAVTYEDRKAKKERAKHRLWEKLAEWVQDYLTFLAPEYAIAY